MNKPQIRRKKSKPLLPDGAVRGIAERLGVEENYVSRVLHNPERYTSVTAQHIRDIASHIQDGLAEKAKSIAASIVEEITE